MYSFGLLSFLPFLRLALVRGTRRTWITLAAYAVATVGIVTAAEAVPERSKLAPVLGGLVLILIGTATTHALIEFRSLDAQLAGYALPPWSGGGADPVAAARARIKLREQARELASRDPVLARELRIGRPDLPRNYDDGGLVDVNNVPQGVLVQFLGLTPQEAAGVLDARAMLGRFSSVEEVSVYAQLPPARVDAIRDLLWCG